MLLWVRANDTDGAAWSMTSRKRRESWHLPLAYPAPRRSVLGLPPMRLRTRPARRHRGRDVGAARHVRDGVCDREGAPAGSLRSRCTTRATLTSPHHTCRADRGYMLGKLHGSSPAPSVPCDTSPPLSRLLRC